MIKSFKYTGKAKQALMGDVLFVKNKPVEVDNGTLIARLTEHHDFEEVKKKEEKKEEPRSTTSDVKQS